MTKLSDILLAAGAFSMTAAGAIESVQDLTPRPCTIQEMCTPLPITLGDEPGRDGPKGLVGLSGASIGSSVTGRTGPSGPAFRA
jgi:hypothetical protein